MHNVLDSCHRYNNAAHPIICERWHCTYIWNTVPAPSQKMERSRVNAYTFCLYFVDFSFRFWNCSEWRVCFIFHFIIYAHMRKT